MAIAFDTSNSLGRTATALFTLSATFGAGVTLAVVEVLSDSGNTDPTLIAPTCNGVAMTPVVSGGVATPGHNDWMNLYYLYNPTSGNIVWTTTGVISGNIAFVSYTGTQSTGALDSSHQDTSSNGGTNTLTFGTTTVANNCWAISGVYSSNNSLSFGGTIASRLPFDNGAGGDAGLCDTNGVVTPAGSVSGTASNSNSGTAAITISVTGASAAVSNSKFLMFM